MRENPFVPESLRAKLLNDQPLDEKELQRELTKLASELTVLIDDVVDNTIIAALHRVYLAIAALGLLTFVLTLLIPSLPLRADKAEDEAHPS